MCNIAVIMHSCGAFNCTCTCDLCTCYMQVQSMFGPSFRNCSFSGIVCFPAPGRNSTLRSAKDLPYRGLIPWKQEQGLSHVSSSLTLPCFFIFLVSCFFIFLVSLSFTMILCVFLASRDSSLWISFVMFCTPLTRSHQESYAPSRLCFGHDCWVRRGRLWGGERNSFTVVYKKQGGG